MKGQEFLFVGERSGVVSLCDYKYIAPLHCNMSELLEKHIRNNKVVIRNICVSCSFVFKQ